MKSETDLIRHLQSTERCGSRYLLSSKKFTTDLFKEKVSTQISPLTLFCRSYFCEPCTQKKALRYRHRIKSHLSQQTWRFLTLTTINDGNNTDAQLQKINLDWNKLSTLLKKKFGKFQYVKSLEIGNSGMVHLHVMLNIFIPIIFLKLYWTKYCGAFKVEISKVKSHELCLRYVTKYITKSTSNFENNKKFYLNNKRRLTFSRQFSEQKDLSEIYTLIVNHIFKEGELKNFLIDFIVTTGIRFEDFDFQHLPPPLQKYFLTDFKTEFPKFIN